MAEDEHFGVIGEGLDFGTEAEVFAHHAAEAAPREVRSGVATHRAALYIGVGFLASLIVGCGSPTRFGTARTLPPGASSRFVSVEMAGPIAVNDERGYALPVPRLGGRIGLTDRLDLGGSFTGLPPYAGEVGLDLKWNFLRSRSVDLAIAPNMNAVIVGEDQVGAFQAGLPLLLGLNIAPWLTLVPQAGVGWLAVHNGGPFVTGAIGTLGVGVEVRPTARFAFQPGIYVMRALDPAHDDILVTGSVGLHFGAQPSYTDER